MYHSTKLLIRWCWEVIKDRDSLKHVNKVIANTPLGLLCLLHVFFQLAQSTADRKGTAIRQQEAFCMRMHQYGLLKCPRGIFCELFTFSTSICRLFSGLNDVYCVQRSTNMFFKVSRYFYDESEFIVASLSPLRGQSFLS